MTGLDDFGPSTYVAPLQAWLDDVAGPEPNERGVRFYTRLAVNDLCRRLEVIDCLAQHPEISEVPIPPILYITGHERSGTTLLHNLLSLDERARHLKRWELMRPTPPPEAATYGADPRIAEMQAPQEKLRGTLLEQMHWVDATDPEECTWGLWNCTGMLGQSPSCVLPRWRDWLTTADMTETFVEYRQLVQLLLWHNPVADSGYLVLKAPQHAPMVETLASVFPDAHFVFTHRDPFRVFTSTSALVGHTNETFLRDPSVLQAGGRGLDAMIRRTEHKFSRMIEADRVLGDRITNVAYPDLIADPTAVVRRIHRDAGHSCPEDLEGRIGTFLAAQKAGRRARPPRDLPSFGLDHQSFLERPAVARYCQHFDVSPEKARMTG